MRLLLAGSALLGVLMLARANSLPDQPRHVTLSQRTPTPYGQLTSSSRPEATITVTKCLLPSTASSASVPFTSGHTYSWTVVGGTLTSGQGQSSIMFTSGTSGTKMTLTVVDTPGPVTSTTSMQVNFSDYPPSDWNHYFDCFYSEVCTIGRNGITVGCGAGKYCPLTALTREQMAVFLLKAEHGASYVPPSCAGTFADVPCSSPFAIWIEQLYEEQITSGCGTSPAIYCPKNQVTRAQMAVFLTKMYRSPSYQPPAACGCVFQDVQTTTFAAAFIEQLSTDGHVASGRCNYCSNPAAPTPTPLPPMYFPNNSVTRDQMARFLTATFGLS